MFRFICVYLFIFFNGWSVYASGFQYDLCVCAIFQNEARFLKEWIEFHKLVGVQHFYLYNNLSTDHYLDVLQPYIAKGEVDLINFPYSSTNVLEFNDIQIHAYEDAVQLAKDKTNWMAFIDTDEFLFPIEKTSLVDFLKDYEEFGGLEVNWQVFGTSSVSKIRKHELLIELLTQKTPEFSPINFNIKSIVHPYLVAKCTGAHNFTYIPPYYSVYVNRAPSFQIHFGPYILVNTIRINHYWTRDEKFLFDVKCARYKNWHHNLEFVKAILPTLNQVEDKTIFKFIPALKKRMYSSPTL